MPGPVLAVAITHSARLGFVAGPLIVLGHALLEGALLLALALGLGALLTQPLVSGVLGGAGGLILLWMGWGMLRSLPSLRLDLAAGPRASLGLEQAWAPVKDGVLLSLSNPYWILWWATVGLGLMALAMHGRLGLWGLLAFYAGHISSDLAWYSLVSLVVSRGRALLSQRVYRGLVGGCALFLLGFGVYFGVFAWRRLLAG